MESQTTHHQRGPPRLVARHLAVRSEPDAAARSRSIAELWTRDGVESVDGVQFRGNDGPADRVADAHEWLVAAGAHQLAHDEDVTVHGDVVMLTLHLIHTEIPDNHQPVWLAGRFLVLAEDSRIRQDHHVTVRSLAQS